MRQFTGTGFPGDFSINYGLYRLVFPVMALGRWAEAYGDHSGRGAARRRGAGPDECHRRAVARRRHASGGRENFPVASRLLARGLRGPCSPCTASRASWTISATRPPGDRPPSWTGLELELDRVFAGEAPEHRHARARRRRCAPASCHAEPFERLIAANRQDQVVARYATFDALLGYCALSAEPVGELVLGVFGAATPDRIALSDQVCAGLQVAEHLQDVPEDLARGRVYLPQADLAVSARPEGPRRRALARRCATRSRSTATGRARCSARAAARAPAAGRPRLAVAGFVAGGRAALDAFERAGWDVSPGRPGRRAAAARGADSLARWSDEAWSSRDAYRVCEQITRHRGGELLLRHPPAAAGSAMR